MKASILFKHGLIAFAATAALMDASTTVQAADKKPNILFIMGDDIGMWNIGAYSRGMMARHHAESRQDGQGRHVVHGLLRRGELHGGPARISSWANCPSAPA